jgi:hypothetical protein
LDHLEKIPTTDPTAAERKQDHIQLAFQSQVETAFLDKRFSYEPILSAHPAASLASFDFLGKQIQTPIWVSSMTGGTEKAYQINANLARACKNSAWVWDWVLVVPCWKAMSDCQILISEKLSETSCPFMPISV